MITRIIISLSLALLCLFNTNAFPLNAGKDYYIFHAGNLVLSSLDGNPSLQSFNASEEQTFQFVPSGNYFLLKNKKTNNYLSKTGTWNTEFSSSTSNVSQFTIEEIGAGFLRFKCRDNNLYLGTDNAAVASNVYSDKSGDGMLHFWYIKEAGAFITEGLEAAIDEAETVLKNTIEGESEGEYSEESRENLSTSIEEAQTILNTSNDQSSIVKATELLRTALSRYQSSKNEAFTEGAKYYVVHAGNRFLTWTDDKLQIKEPAFSESQQFLFEKLSDGTYAVKNVASGKYISASGNYSTTLSDNNAASTTHFTIDYAPSEEEYIRFQFASNSLFLGTDATTDGGGIFSDKSGSDGKHYWRLMRVDAPSQQPYHNFRNGSSALRLGLNWLDEEGNHINAHGGCVLYDKGTYYWFGENYRTTGAVKSNGIVCYSSKDLYNWKKEGMAYECPTAPLRDDYQDMNYGRTLERPKVMYCPNTNQYVMWVHWENGSGYAASRVAILYSDKITGPYTFVKTIRPRGDEQPSGSRDQTLLFDPDYNVAYHFGSAEENMTMHVTLLTNDFLDLSETWQRIFIKKQYEAPAVIKYHGRFIAITSGCTGWNPNPAHNSYSELPLSGWVDLGNPCVDGNYATSYNTQGNYIFEVPEKYNAYIYMADRWKGGDYFTDANVGESWHIWLPIDMRTGYPILHFYPKWDLSLFDKINRYRRVKSFLLGNEYLLLSRNANRIFSEKNGRFLLSSDDEELNIKFSIHQGQEDCYYIQNSESGQMLSVVNGNLCWKEFAEEVDQQWIITSAGNDGYYYISPKSDSTMALKNYCATPNSDGIIALGEKASDASCKFAFCFDSEKNDYESIEDESDGSYKEWIENELHYTPTTQNDDYMLPDAASKLLVYTEKNQLSILSLTDQDMYLHTTSGELVKHTSMRENEFLQVDLPSGMYIVNGIKILIP